MDLFAGLALAVAIAAAVAVALRGRWRALGNVPLPAGASWLWGHDLTVRTLNVGVAYRQWFDAHGPLVRMRAAFGHPDILIAADLGVVEHIMRTASYDYWHSNAVRTRVSRLLGRSIGWAEGSEHRRMRRLVSPHFSATMAKAFAPLVTDCAQRAAAFLSDAVITSGAPNRVHVVNILDSTSKVMLEITGRASFDHDFAAGDSPDAKAIFGAWRRMITVGMSRKGFISFLLIRRFPFLNYLPIKANLAHSVVKTTIQKDVAAAMLARDTGKSTSSTGGKDLLTLLMNANKRGEIPTQELLDHITQFIMAGHETTSTTLSYTLWELARHPDVQARLRAELRSVPPGPGYDALMNELPFLDAVARETLRVYPSLPYMERVATRDDVLPLATPIMTPNGPVTHVPVRAGQVVVIPIISMQQQAAVWGPDATTWRPERWLDEKALPDASVRPRAWGGMLTFSDGARVCIGWRLGLLQYKAALAAMVRELAFVDTGAEISHILTSSMQPYIRGKEDAGPQLPLGVTLAP